MKRSTVCFKPNSMPRFFMALFLFTTPLAGVYAACCAGHGGVVSCNKTTGQQMCKDGTASPTCQCKKATKKATKKENVPAAAKPKKAQKTIKTQPDAKSSAGSTTTAPKSKPKSSWWGGETPTKTTPSNTSVQGAKGCCSRHGGVAQCNRATGYQMCRDGTTSPTCACR